MEKSLLVTLCEKLAKSSGYRNRVVTMVLGAYEDGVDIGRLHLANMQTASLLSGGHRVTDPEFDRQITDERYLTELRQAFSDESKRRLTEAGPWTSNLAFAEPFTGPVPAPYAKLIKQEIFEGAEWRKIVNIERVENFKLQSRLKLEDLAEYERVPEGGEYNTSPREGYKAFYRVAKYGLTVAITWEMIVNDDMKAFSDLMQQLVWSGLHSMNAYVWGWIVANPVIYTGNTLFNLNHNNLMTVALSIAALTTARAMMNRHLTPGGKPIAGITPKYCVIPPELEGTLDVILQSSGQPVAQMSAGVYNPEYGKLSKIMTAYLVDVDDWYLWCEPSSVPVMEIGFLFGRSTPEMSQNDIWASEEVHYRGKYAMGHVFTGYRGALLSTLSVGTS